MARRWLLAVLALVLAAPAFAQNPNQQRGPFDSQPGVQGALPDGTPARPFNITNSVGTTPATPSYVTQTTPAYALLGTYGGAGGTTGAPAAVGPVYGGSYIHRVYGIFAGASVQLQTLAADGVTWLSIGAPITAATQNVVAFGAPPSGSPANVRVVVTGSGYTLWSDITYTSALAVSGGVVAQGTGFWQDNIAQFGGTTVNIGQQLRAASIPVTLASDQLAVTIVPASTTSATDTQRLAVTSPDGQVFGGSISAVGVIPCGTGPACNQSTGAIDTTNYGAIAEQVVSAGTGNTINYEQSNDLTTWFGITGVSIGVNGTALNLPAQADGLVASRAFTVGLRYFRVRVSGYTSGTISIVGYLRSQPIPQLDPQTAIRSVSLSNASSAAPGTAGSTALQASCKYVAAGVTLTDGQAAACKATESGAVAVSESPSSNPTNAIVGSAAALTSGLLLKGSAGNLYDAYVGTRATAGFVAIANMAALPASGGAITGLVECVAIAANSQQPFGYNSMPESFSLGIALLFSTTDCNVASPVYTVSATTFMHGRVK